MIAVCMECVHFACICPVILHLPDLVVLIRVSCFAGRMGKAAHREGKMGQQTAMR